MKLKLGSYIVIGLVLAAAVLGISQYFKSKGVTGPSIASGGNPFSSSSSTQTFFTMSGSNTIGADLAPKLVRAFLQQKGAIGVDINRISPEEIQVTGVINGQAGVVKINAHGSATAFTDLASNAANIGMSSRPINGTEAQKLGRVNEKVIGLDGVVVVVNNNSSMNASSKPDLANIFTSGQMNVYSLDAKSGTFDTFKNLVLRGKDLPASAKRFEDMQSLVNGVATDPNGIGFTSLAAARNVKKLAVADGPDTAPVAASEMTIRTESYPLTRRLFLYSVNPTGMVSDFIAFSGSDAGQTVVEDVGFVAQKVEKIQTPELVTRTTSPEYRQLATKDNRLDVDLRFQVGSSDLDSKAVDDIDRIIQATAGRGIVLVGFSDSTGNPASNIQLSKDRAQTVARVLATKGVTPVQVLGMGPINPVASNATPDGREKNRRVEVWLAN